MRQIRKYLLLTPAWIILGITLVGPLLVMFAISFAERGVYGGTHVPENIKMHIFSGHFLRNYLASLNSLYFPVYWRSLWLAIVTTLLCLLLSYPMAYHIAVKVRPRNRPWILSLVVIPFWTCFLIRTYAWMFILRSEGLANQLLLSWGWIHEPLPLLYNDFAVLMGLVYGELPFMILPLYASLEKLDPRLLEASSDLGASPTSTFWRITVPLSFPGMMAGCVLVLIPSIGQFLVSDLLGGAKSMLIGNLIQNQFSSVRNQPFGSALSFELIILVLLILFVFTRLARKRMGEEFL